MTNEIDLDISAADRKALEWFHPMFMGGNYLPDTEDGDLEITRISIKSATSDVTCVYAQPDGNRIHYRAVDEYGGDTLQGTTEARTDTPMRLGDFADFLLRASLLLDFLQMNFENDLDRNLDLFTAPQVPSSTPTYSPQGSKFLSVIPIC